MLYDYALPFLFHLRTWTQRFLDYQDRWIDVLCGSG